MNTSDTGRGEDAVIVEFGEGWAGIRSCIPNVLVFVALGSQVLCQDGGTG